MNDSPLSSLKALRLKAAPAQQIYAFPWPAKKEKHPQTGQEIEVMYYDIRRPAKLTYKCFSSLDAFNDFCARNRIHTRNFKNL